MVEIANAAIAFFALLATIIFSTLAYIQGRRKERKYAYSVKDCDWVEGREYSYERLLRELVGLDYASIPSLNQADEGLPAQWAPLFEKSKETWRLVVNRENVIVAYWSFFFLTDDAIDAVKEGRLYEGKLADADILVPIEPASRPIFVSMLAIHPALETEKEIQALLYGSIVSAIDELQSEGITVTDIYANAFTKKGRNIATKMGLSERGVEHDGRPILVGKWTDELRRKLIRHSERAARHVP